MMEDSELEEGEACSSHVNDFDPNLDPDVALSYLDEKIQDYLGHFQKDFEGGVVSAEILGSKFGGYGSFLPSYQRSPVGTHPRTPARLQNNGLPKSPNSLKSKAGHRNNSNYGLSQSVGLGTASTSSISLAAPKAPSENIPVKQDVSVSCNRADFYPHEQEPAKKKPIKLQNQKSLKVRLKVGSDNLLTQKNDIYSGLGLGGTPSSSLDESSDSEGISHVPQDSLFESPTSILQIMTSCPVYEGLLLSPLPQDLLYLTEKKIMSKEVRFGLVNGEHTREAGRKVSGVRKPKSFERNDISAESKSGNKRDGIRLLAKQDQDTDTFACRELVTKSKEADKNLLRNTGFPCQAEDEPVEPTSNQEQNWVERRKAILDRTVQEDRKVSSNNNVKVLPKKNEYRKEKSNGSAKANSNVSKGRKSVSTEVMDQSKQKGSQKGLAHEVDDMRLLSRKVQPLPGKKRKSKEIPRTPVIDFPEEFSKVGSTSMPKVKSTHVGKVTSNGESERLRKGLDKSRDANRDFFGDEEEDNLINSLHLPSEAKLDGSDAVAKSAHAVDISSREKPYSNPLDVHTVTASNIDQRPEIGPISDSAPALMGDPWVQCDKCLKWRLLPHGTTPDNLPEKWLCSMFNWLPGMNRCSVTEEETTEKTKALSAQYHVAAPGSQNYLPNNIGGFVESGALANFGHPDQNLQNFSVQATPGGGKKKNGMTESSRESDKDASILLPCSNKNLQVSLKSRSLNDVIQSSPLNEPNFQQLSNSSDLRVEKQKQAYENKQAGSGFSYDGGHINSLKVKNRRDFDPDTSRAPKKIKREGRRMNDDEGASDHHGLDGEVGPSSSTGFLATEVGKDRYKDKLGDATFTKLKDEVCRDNGSIDMGNVITDRPKKRKLEDYPEIHMGSLPNHSTAVKEEFSENDCRKEKKARASKSDGRESSASKGSGRTGRKSSHMKKQQSAKNMSSRIQQTQNGVDSLKKDLGSGQVSVAAISSSSKISGSQKTKSSFPDIKDSPVESVSSSPMRILNPDKHELVPRDLKPMDESHYIGEDDSRIDQLGTAKMVKIHFGAHHGSESSLLDVQDRYFCLISGGKAREQIVASLDIANNIPANGALDISGTDGRSPIEPLVSDQFAGEDRENGSQYNAQGSQPRNSGKSHASRSMEKQSYRSDSDMGRSRNSNFVSVHHGHSTSPGMKARDVKNKLLEKVNKNVESENKYVSKNDFPKKSLNDDSRRESQSNSRVHDGPDIRLDAVNPKDMISTPKKHPDSDSERSSKRTPGRHDRVDAGSTRGKSLPLPPSGGAQPEMTRWPLPVSGSHKGNGADLSEVNGSGGNDAVKVQSSNIKADTQNGNQHISSRHRAQNGQRPRNLDAPSPCRRDSSTAAYMSILKEAKAMKHLADRYKNNEENDKTGLYFQAVLKFLHAASLLESPNIESAKHIESMEMYRSTTALCQFCAREFEKSKDMASAALAFKCLEVAYLKVIYSSHSTAGRDRHELHAALQMIPPGESPSSSASDVDNLNNPSTADKAPLPKGVSSPQVAGNHIIAARSRPSFVRMLKFTEDVNSAMDASKKSCIAFAAAVEEAKYSGCISSIKRALDFNFQDVEGLLHLVRLATEAISNICQSPDGGGEDIKTRTLVVNSLVSGSEWMT